MRSPPKDDGPPRYRVSLEDSSWIEGRGVRHTKWLVKVNDSWVKLRDLRDVASTMAEPTASYDEEDVDELKVLPAGCQYRITYHPRLLYGAELKRCVSVPQDEAPSRDVPPKSIMDSFGRFKARLRVIVTEYRVTGEQRLVTEDRWQRARKEPEQRRRKEPVRERIITVAELEAFRAKLNETLKPPKTGSTSS
jgi:hypothetical protein